jgi:tetratricopeptide (TPR) repeat protein
MKYLLFIFGIVVIISCNTKKDRTNTSNNLPNDSIQNELLYYSNKKNKDLIILNDNAVKVLHNIDRVTDSKMKDSLLNKAMSDLNKVIQKDSNFYFAYMNKAAVLRRLGKYQESIEVLQKLLERKKTPEA